MIIEESNRIELKRQLSHNLEKDVVAFLNYRDGGVIYIGIDDKTKEFVRIGSVDETQLKIKDRLKNNIFPSTLGLFDVIHQVEKDKHFIKINIASGPEKPYYLKKQGMSGKGCFIRIGSASEPMPVKMIEELFSKRIRNSIGKINSPKDNLAFEQLKIYYQEKRFELNDKFIANLELLTSESNYNYAAYLLSDVNNISIKVAKYKGIDRVDLIENNEFGFCSLVKVTKQVLSKLEVENTTITKITSRERIENHLVDAIALREAVVNAIVHNDYTNEIPPKFEIFSDRLEITSAGRIPQGLSVHEFFSGYSAPRNKELMRIFKDLELVEYLGSGIPRILKKYDRSIFNITDNFLRITYLFPVRTDLQKTVKENMKKMSEKMSEKILELLKEKPQISAKEMADFFGKSARTIEREIQKLKEQSKIKRVGPAKGGHWTVIENHID